VLAFLKVLSTPSKRREARNPWHKRTRMLQNVKIINSSFHSGKVIQKPNFRSNFHYSILLYTTVLPDIGASTEPPKHNIDNIQDRILLLRIETLPYVSTRLSHLVGILLQTHTDIKDSTIELITVYYFHQWSSGPTAVNIEILKSHASWLVSLDTQVVQNGQDRGGFTD
jgi:hypothetical protein